MHALLIILLIVAALGPFAVARFMAGLGCFVLLAIGALWLLGFGLTCNTRTNHKHKQTFS
jgi:hypothetical protein